MILFDYINKPEGFLVLEKGHSKSKIGATKSSKSKIPTYDTIEDALKSDLSKGGLFTTHGADRIYMVTASPWGKGTQEFGGKTAKGFSKGKDQSPKNPSFKALKNASLRAKERAGIDKKETSGEEHHSKKDAGEVGASEDK